MNKQLPPAVWVAARIFVGLVFAYAGFSKLIEPVENFRGAIAEYQVIPYAFVPALAYALPWIELLCGVFLIAGYAVKMSAAALALLSLGFLLVLGSSSLLLESVPISCGCFGQGGIHLTVRQIFFLDLLDLGICLKLYSFKEHFLSLDQVLKKTQKAKHKSFRPNSGGSVLWRKNHK